MKNFRTYNLAVEFYKKSQTLALPRHLREQFSRASSSIALNLAEGAGKSSRTDVKRFYQIAFGSLRECQSILDLVNKQDSEVSNSLDSLAAHLYKLIKAT